MIALVGQSVLDRVVRADGTREERLGGAPLYAAQALRAAGEDAVVLTRGGDSQLRAPLRALGYPVVVGPGRATFVSELQLRPDGERLQSIAAFGDPFSAADAAGWLEPWLERADAIVLGTQWADDLAPGALAAFIATGAAVCLDGQGPARAAELGPLRLRSGLAPGELAGARVVKLSEEEAAALVPGPLAESADRLGVGAVLVTRGAGGVTVIEPGGRSTELPVEPVAGDDTVGAGDAFLALAAASLARGAGTVEAARSAAAGVAQLLAGRIRQGTARVDSKVVPRSSL